MAADSIPCSDSFPPTQWTQVELAGQRMPHGPAPALEQLLTRYAPVLRSHLLRRRLPAADVDDVLQDFIADKVLKQNLLARADRSRGRFRSFICSALNHYAANRHRSQMSQKRSPGALGSLDAGHHTCGVDDTSPSDAFDIDWARSILAQTVQRMRERCQAAGREDVWTVFDCRIRAPMLESVPIVPYEQLIQRLSLTTPLEAANILVTAKRMFQRTLREVIGEYAMEPDAVEDEIRDLIDILSRARAEP